MKSWRSFIPNALGVIVMGRLDAPHLAQRVDGILLRSLEIFLSDPDIIERYNLAFSKGWKSPQWQDIPTLKDLVHFCSIARLNIQKPEAIDHQAINQITSQIAALLVSPLGNAIASLLVGGVMGFAWMVWSIFFASKPVVKAPNPKATSTMVASGETDEAARLKAELALGNQESRNLEQPQKQTKPERIQPVASSKVRSTLPPPRIIRERIPSPLRIIRETVTGNKPQAKPVSVTSPTPKVEKFDPFERWNQLATLGQQTMKNGAAASPDTSLWAKEAEILFGS
ncbi:hypothetical protein OGM63_25385 [Plectonema radiosum NIES-515]|uniref:Uncharacterized protein n=1 Tax=Plectonema radiosum NIES-515 TaxID=2986073 RepID=A0ABT3B5Z6_9CYAN|nr:hypothetical protein [Plectonema radiosum]MCV3216798.1 hypothetical protein [Plectonema radiosum NIES-515]